MYFGSVRFFKHLILAVVALLIIVPFVTAAVLAAENASLKKEVAALSERISEFKKEADDSQNPRTQPEKTEPETTTTASQTVGGAEPSDTSDAEPSGTSKPPEPAYVSLYPDLYADSVTDEPDENYANDDLTVYLTFDDGPSAYTDDILRYLKEDGVSATFFVIPDENSENRLNQILADGHSLGIHTKSHDLKKIYAGVEEYLTDFKEAYDLVYEQTGYKPDIFRFPGGSKNDYNADVRDDIIREMTRRGFVYFDWNVDSRDAMGAGWKEILDTVKKEVAEAMARTDVANRRAVVLMHDRPGGQNTVLVLEDIISALKNDPNGYTFSKLGKNVKPLIF